MTEDDGKTLERLWAMLDGVQQDLVTMQGYQTKIYDRLAGVEEGLTDLQKRFEAAPRPDEGKKELDAWGKEIADKLEMPEE